MATMDEVILTLEEIRLGYREEAADCPPEYKPYFDAAEGALKAFAGRLIDSNHTREDEEEAYSIVLDHYIGLIRTLLEADSSASLGGMIRGYRDSVEMLESMLR